MITYEWARLPDNRGFVAFANDTLFNVKMFTFGISHDKIRRNFAIILKHSGKTNGINAGRFLMAGDSNPDLIEKFGQYRRGGILKGECSIQSAAEKRQIRLEQKKEDDKIKEDLFKQKELEESFDRFITKTDENGNIYIYGIKLIKTYKNKENNNEEDISSNI